MDDALGMGGVEAVGDFDGMVEKLVGFKRAAFDAMLQRFAFEKFHHDEKPAVVLVNLVNRADTRVIESGRGASFALEALDGLGIASNFVRQEFEGDKAAQSGVLGLVHNAHAAAAKLFEDAVVGQRAANHEWSSPLCRILGCVLPRVNEAACGSATGLRQIGGARAIRIASAERAET